MTATWASYLAEGAPALAAVVALQAGQVAELRRRVAALEPHDTGISELLDPARGRAE